MNSEAQRRLEMKRHLQRALQSGELSLHYRPQTDLDSGEPDNGRRRLLKLAYGCEYQYEQ